ncbi:MAG: hypothetical protein WA821_04255 [Anaerolineales bacterium]
MTTLAPDEKSTLVMVYTQNALVRGEVVTKGNVRVSIWLRTDGAPNFFHLRNAQMLFFGGGPVRSSNYAEMYVPSAAVVGFHLAPPAQEPLDYEEGEKNRAVEIVSAGVGTFIFKGKVRFSAQSGLASSLEMIKTWMSMYDAEITNPSLPQMPAIQVPMLLLNPGKVTFGL